MEHKELVKKSFPAAILIAVVIAGFGCGTGGSEEQPLDISYSGTVEAGDSTDPNHGNLLYDAYEFEAERFEVVSIGATAEGFSPLLKLVEVETGAVLAEWEAEYSDDEALIYRIAAPGLYEARVYAMEPGTWDYTLTVKTLP